MTDETVELLSAPGIRRTIEEGIPETIVTGKRILVLTPDGTRTCPLPMVIRILNETVGSKAKKLDFMVALGTHTPLPKEKILELYGITPEERLQSFKNSEFLNHRWDLVESFTTIGEITSDDVGTDTADLLDMPVRVEVNRRIFEYDLIIIMGPVFPHEVVGFSGGAKYIFPGIAGGEFLHFFHWLGAVLTCRRVIGVKETPVRNLISRAMEMISIPVLCISMVVRRDTSLCGLFVGGHQESWSRAADLSAKVHVQFRKKRFHTVLGCCPEMYDELWTAGKVMYKLEQMVEKGGRLIIYAPHIKEISRTWGKEIARIGYHVKDYFLSQMKRFREVPGGVLAHSTHVKGTGTCIGGVELPDVEVILATSLSEEVCRSINLGYMDPDKIDRDRFKNREEEGILYVNKAGEILYQLQDERF